MPRDKGPELFDPRDKVADRVAAIRAIQKALQQFADPSVMGGAALIFAARCAQNDGIDSFGWDVLTRLFWDTAQKSGSAIDQLAKSAST